MDVLNSAIVALTIDGGYPVLGVVILVSSIGAPVPASLIVVIAGSVAALDGISPVPLFALVTIASVTGDSIGYYVGRRLGTVRLQPHGRWAWFVTAGSEVQRYFRPWSGLTVFLTRWLFTPFASAVNLLAGISRYPFRRFVIFATTGEAISSALFLGVGYAFGVNSTYVWDYFDGVPGVLAAGALGLVLTAIGIRWLLRPDRTSARQAG